MMTRRTFLGWILAPFLIPPLPKDWHARKTLCSATSDGPIGNRGPCGGPAFYPSAQGQIEPPFKGELTVIWETEKREILERLEQLEHQKVITQRWPLE